jgi:DNA ligase D-like protein (predicted polymerase)
MAKPQGTVLEAAGREVLITNPDKVFFPRIGATKLDLATYYAAVAEGALRGIAGRPIVLKRYVDGAEGAPFFQKRAPEQHPDWIETVDLRFPSGRSAREIVVRDAAQLLWIVNLGCIDLNPHPVRADDLEHPDELRIDLDPGPGVSWEDIRRVTLLVHEVLDERGLRGWPKTSGSRGMHVNARIERRWTFDQVRRAALALAREVERRAPDLATSKWWKEERHGVFLDYNQNAKDRTVASAWSVRPTSDARVSMPLSWDEVPDCDPAAFTLSTAPARFAARGDAASGIDGAAGSLDGLLELSASQEAAGLGDAPWPPHYRKQRDEPPRVAPSRRRTASGGSPPPATESAEPRPSRASAALLVTVAKAAVAADALAGLEQWKARHPAAAARLHEDDVLVDSMRGRSSTWTRVRVNLRHVPADERPAPEPPAPDYDPWSAPGRRPSGPRAPKTRSSS